LSFFSLSKKTTNAKIQKRIAKETHPQVHSWHYSFFIHFAKVKIYSAEPRPPPPRPTQTWLGEYRKNGCSRRNWFYKWRIRKSCLILDVQMRERVIVVVYIFQFAKTLVSGWKRFLGIYKKKRSIHTIVACEIQMLKRCQSIFSAGAVTWIDDSVCWSFSKEKYIDFEKNIMWH